MELKHDCEGIAWYEKKVEKCITFGCARHGRRERVLAWWSWSIISLKVLYFIFRTWVNKPPQSSFIHPSFPILLYIRFRVLILLPILNYFFSSLIFPCSFWWWLLLLLFVDDIKREKHRERYKEENERWKGVRIGINHLHLHLIHFPF